MSFLRFFAIILFCTGCFFAGRFFYAPFEQIKTTQSDVPIITQNFPAEIIPSIVPPAERGTSQTSTTMQIPTVAGVVSSEATKVVPMPPGARLGNQDGWNIFIKDIRVSFDEKKES